MTQDSGNAERPSKVGDGNDVAEIDHTPTIGNGLSSGLQSGGTIPGGGPGAGVGSIGTGGGSTGGASTGNVPSSGH